VEFSKSSLSMASLFSNVSCCVVIVMSSAYANFREVVSRRSLMYRLKRVGASTEPWSRSLFNCFVELLDAPILTIKRRFVNISFNNL